MHLSLSSHLFFIALGCLRHVDALIHEQVAFDSSNVCWWSLTPPDPICPVLKQQNITQLIENLKSSNQWVGGTECEGIYCLYSYRGFAGGRGISVITTSENVDKVKHVGDVLQEYEVSFDDDSEKVPFRTKRVGGRVEAVVASNKLKRGDPIMAHTPVLLVHQKFKEEAPKMKQQRLLNLAIDALPETTAEKLKGRISDKSNLHALLSSDSFVVNLEGPTGDKDQAHDGIFPEAASVSHNCRPNTVYYVDQITLMLITTAAQPIKPGEELTQSRLDPFATREERQAQAHARWGSGCICSHCTLSDSAADDSETRLHEIKWIESKLRDMESIEVSTGLVSYHLGLHENEGLHCCLSSAYALAAENFNMLGHAKYAAKYADLAIEAFKMEKGEGVNEVREMEALRRNPKKHATWKARVRIQKAKSESGITGPAAVTTAASTALPVQTGPAAA